MVYFGEVIFVVLCVTFSQVSYPLLFVTVIDQAHRAMLVQNLFVHNTPCTLFQEFISRV